MLHKFFCMFSGRIRLNPSQPKNGLLLKSAENAHVCPSAGYGVGKKKQGV